VRAASGASYSVDEETYTPTTVAESDDCVKLHDDRKRASKGAARGDRSAQCSERTPVAAHSELHSSFSSPLLHSSRFPSLWGLDRAPQISGPHE
jgi:hypothetical protein